MKALLGSPSVKILSLFFFVLKPGFLLSPFFFLSFEIQHLVGIFHLASHIALGVLEIILQHAPHPVEFESLLVVKFVFIFLLFFSLSFFLYLLIQPLFLFIFEEFPSGVMFYVSENVLRSSPSNYLHPDII